MPTIAEPPATPLTDQVTEVFALPATMATNVCEMPSGTEAVTGETVMVTGGGVGASVTVACANDVGLATEVARMVTVVDEGITVGAV